MKLKRSFGEVLKEIKDSSTTMEHKEFTTEIIRIVEGVGNIDMDDVELVNDIKLMGNLSFSIEKLSDTQVHAIYLTLKKIDVFCNLNTGAGKSMIYQLPATMDNGVTIVISPLTSLMVDQSNFLFSETIPNVIIQPNQTVESFKKIKDRLFHKVEYLQTKVLYVTPEMLSKSKKVQNLMDELYRRKIMSRIVIDECHVILEWGKHFRVDYSFLSIFRETYKDVPYLLLTASAT